MSLKPLVFVAMPFGVKESDRIAIDFDSIYSNGIKPSISESNKDLDIIRADEERMGGFIHGPMYERLLLSEIVIADLTLANANVFYELGIRHCAKPKSTILIFSHDTRLPFDVSPLRAIPYTLEDGELKKENAQQLKEEIQKRINEALEDESAKDSPLFQFIKDFPGVNLTPDQTESFHSRLFHIDGIREKLKLSRIKPKLDAISEIKAIEDELGDFQVASHEILLDLLLSYRDIESWEDMIRVVEYFPSSIKESIQIQEQLALALNRRNQDNDRERAISMLDSVISQFGPSSETLGILGRIYKDKFVEMDKLKGRARAKGPLKKAIRTYKEGFITDPRDYYPGINALTLMLVENSDQSKEDFKKLEPLVEFAIERQGGGQSKSYWVQATALELAILKQDWNTATENLGEIMSDNHSLMKRKTTANNFEFILEQYKSQGISTVRLEEIILELKEEA